MNKKIWKIIISILFSGSMIALTVLGVTGNLTKAMHTHSDGSVHTEDDDHDDHNNN